MGAAFQGQEVWQWTPKDFKNSCSTTKNLLSGTCAQIDLKECSFMSCLPQRNPQTARCPTTGINDSPSLPTVGFHRARKSHGGRGLSCTTGGRGDRRAHFQTRVAVLSKSEYRPTPGLGLH